MAAEIVGLIRGADREYRIVVGATTMPSPVIEYRVGIDSLGAPRWDAITAQTPGAVIWDALRATIGYVATGAAVKPTPE